VPEVDRAPAHIGRHCRAQGRRGRAPRRRSIERCSTWSWWRGGRRDGRALRRHDRGHGRTPPSRSLILFHDDADGPSSLDAGSRRSPCHLAGTRRRAPRRYISPPTAKTGATLAADHRALLVRTDLRWRCWRPTTSRSAHIDRIVCCRSRLPDRRRSSWSAYDWTLSRRWARVAQGQRLVVAGLSPSFARPAGARRSPPSTTCRPSATTFRRHIRSDHREYCRSAGRRSGRADQHRDAPSSRCWLASRLGMAPCPGRSSGASTAGERPLSGRATTPSQSSCGRCARTWAKVRRCGWRSSRGCAAPSWWADVAAETAPWDVAIHDKGREARTAHLPDLPDPRLGEVTCSSGRWKRCAGDSVGRRGTGDGGPPDRREPMPRGVNASRSRGGAQEFKTMTEHEPDLSLASETAWPARASRASRRPTGASPN